jgi:hypothetical protein
MVLRRLEERGVSLTLPARRSGEARLNVGAVRAVWTEKCAAADRGESHLRDLESGGIKLLQAFKEFRGGADWRIEGQPAEGRLWAYTLHYHEWILDIACAYQLTRDERYAAAVRRWISDWIDACPPGIQGFANFPWNSYTIATRLSAWGRLAAVLPVAFWDADQGFAGKVGDSASMQAQYLEGHLEWDLRGNHLFRDAVGLAWAARLLESPKSDRWMRRAAAITASQIGEQVQEDGSHFELSPAYHLQVIDDLLALRQLGADTSGSVRSALPAMFEFASWARWPDGAPLLLNDSTEKGTVSLEKLSQRAMSGWFAADLRRREGTRYFRDFGLVVHNGPRWSLFFDVGRVGPDVQPGHAHADSLSAIAALDGERIFIDPGVYAYDRSAARAYSRSTAAHNTVAVNSADSSEVWDIFRVGRRARPVGVEVSISDSGVSACASHDGYDHHPGRPRHRRLVEIRGASLEIVDYVVGNHPFMTEGGWLLSPEWRAVVSERGWVLNHTSGKTVHVELSAEPSVVRNVSARQYFPNFGEAIDVQRLEWVAAGSQQVRVRTVISPID